MMVLHYYYERSASVAYVGIPACLLWLHGIEHMPFGIGSGLLFVFWYVIPLAQIWGFQAKTALAELKLANAELERLLILNRNIGHE